ncbi:hypothetical protein JCM3775_006707 [Rhodotorula graminis]|uniref:Uncharacterized protein n=1 Tax=Rhodotorula graminis (strain WP1) TaxID=578459 RepID=A0A194S960_RHOGW|nr:uncharacterized protein RHOBADRAFT_42329 [Rhodotorula graminis WP1]KPV77119.1 hypothetical protein RHOBADRAFT_42329 [Rhodotorula graminis WP1]
MLAEGHRVDRLDRERVWRIWRRHDALKPRYSVLRSTGADEIRLSVPSWSNFRLLPSVEPLWLPEGDVVSDEQWQAALPSILADLATARRVLKVAYARRVVEPLVKAGALTDSSLADALKASKRPLKPTGALFDETDFGDYERVHRHFSRMYMDGPVGFLDLGDKADGVDELELDALLSQAVATFVHVGSSGQATLVPFPDIVPMLDKYGSRPEAVDDGQLETPSVQFIQQQLDVLERAGLPNHRSSVAELEALGPVFECHGCGVAAPAASDGVKSSSLCWSEMLRHACTVHRDFYAASGEHLPSAVPEIRLSTSTYPPDSPVPPPASSTTAVADVATA